MSGNPSLPHGVSLLRGLCSASLALWIFAADTGPVAAQAPSGPQIVAVRVGFGGHYKVGQWTPVFVTIRGGSESLTGHVQLVVPDGDGVPSRVISSKPYLVASGQSITAVMHAKFGRIESQMEVRFVDLGRGKTFVRRQIEDMEEGDALHIPWAMYSSQDLMVGLGGSTGLDEALKLHQGGERNTDPELGRIDSIEQMPTRWYGYEGVDTLVIATSQPEMFRSLASNSDQVVALDQWVRMGGRLVLYVGQSAQEILHADHPFSRFSPGEFQGMTTLSQLNDLETYSETQEPIPLPRGDKVELPVPRLAKVRGRVEVPDVAGTDLPLVIRTPYGFGEVVFVAVDLDRRPFLDWSARGQFVSKLLGKPAAGRGEKADKTSDQVSSLGLVDLSGQLRGALDQFTGVKLVPFWVVAGSVFVYILLIGPGDYFLVRNFFKRMELTWITFPSIVLLVSVGAYLMAVWAKGSELRLNQVDLVDVLVERDSPANFARGTTWLNIFTPRTDAYHLSLEPRLPDGTAPEPNQAKVLLSWLGVPGGGLGGSDQRRSSQPLFNRPYRFSQELDQLDQLPIQVWSTKGLTSRWYAPEDGSLEIDLKLSEDQNLEGQITNTLKVPLEDCWLAYDRWVYRIGKFEPGETLDVKSRWRDREVLTSALTENKLDYDAQKKQSVLVSTPYDQESFDVRRILRQMMFHKASGGDAYARLTNRYQSFVDMSDHLTLGRAILVGYTDQPSAQLQRSFDGGQTWTPVKGPEDRRWTCYRFVVPVE